MKFANFDFSEKFIGDISTSLDTCYDITDRDVYPWTTSTKTFASKFEYKLAAKVG